VDGANTIIRDVVLGGLYTLFAPGLSVVFGIMRVDPRYGDFLVLAAFLGVVAVGQPACTRS